MRSWTPMPAFDPFYLLGVDLDDALADYCGDTRLPVDSSTLVASLPALDRDERERLIIGELVPAFLVPKRRKRRGHTDLGGKGAVRRAYAKHLDECLLTEGYSDRGWGWSSGDRMHFFIDGNAICHLRVANHYGPIDPRIGREAHVFDCLSCVAMLKREWQMGKQFRP